MNAHVIMSENEGPLLPQLSVYGNWAVKEGENQKIYRLLAYQGDTAWMMLIGTVTKGTFTRLSPPRNASLRTPWAPRKIRHLLRENRLSHIDERGLPPQIAVPAIEEGVDQNLDLKRRVVACMEEKGGDSLIWDKAVYAETIMVVAAANNISLPTARAWFETHLFYGRSANALIRHDWNKGAPGVSRRGLRNALGKPVEALGRPTDSEQVYANARYRRKRLTEKRFNDFCNYVRREAWATNDGITRIIERYKSTMVAFTRGEDGIKRAYPVDPKHLPNDDNLRKVGSEVLKIARIMRDEERKYKAGQKRKVSGGSAQDLVHGELSVLDIDATPADFTLAFGSEAVMIAGYGKPRILLAVDRGSNAIVGWDVTFKNENTNSYKRCIFSAYTPKEEELWKWGVPYLKGMVFGCASQIFVDRGPGVSIQMAKAIAARLRSDALMAEPGDPSGKGHVEQLMGAIQKALSELPGSTYGTGNAEIDRHRRLNATKGLVLTIDLFMPLFLEAISERNLTLDVRHLLTNRMLEQGVAPIPIEIYNFNKGSRRGDFAWDWPEEKIYRNLCIRHENKKAPMGNVTIDGGKFTSPELKNYVHRWLELHGGKTPLVTVMEIPHSEFFLFWERSDGQYLILEATNQTKELYKDDLKDLNKQRQKQRTAAYKESRYKSRMNPQKLDAQRKDILSRAKQMRISRAEQASMGSVENISADEAKLLEKKRYENDVAGMLFNRVGVAEPVQVDQDTKLPISLNDYAYDDEQVFDTDF